MRSAVECSRHIAVSDWRLHGKYQPVAGQSPTPSQSCQPLNAATRWRLRFVVASHKQLRVHFWSCQALACIGTVAATNLVGHQSLV